MILAYMFPGQGAQRKGMGGAELFARFPREVEAASDVLGYSVRELCLEDRHERLDRTEFTQPAIYVTSALHYFEKTNEGGRPHYVAGHSLGEYNALLAAGAFDFLTGLRLVQKRGELMARARGGGMAAVIGLSEDEVQRELATRFETVDVANLNAPNQIVIAGPREDVERAAAHFTSATDAHVTLLRVSGAFHSRYMAAAQVEFGAALRGLRFGKLCVPVISNARALPYEDDAIASTLAAQMTAPVQWAKTVSLLLSLDGVELEEVGPGTTLTAIARRIKIHRKHPLAGARSRGEPA